MMDATLILIDSNAELVRAHALVDRLWNSENPADVARLQAQARLSLPIRKAAWRWCSGCVHDFECPQTFSFHRQSRRAVRQNGRQPDAHRTLASVRPANEKPRRKAGAVNIG
jgi:hypothetical protein